MSPDDLVGMAEKAVRGGFFLFVGNALSTVILAAGSTIIARLRGPSNCGVYTLTSLMPLVFVSIADAGINSAPIRMPARLRSEGDHSASNRAIRLYFLLKLALAKFFRCPQTVNCFRRQAAIDADNVVISMKYLNSTSYSAGCATCIRTT